jgi:hypothetical protein
VRPRELAAIALASAAAGALALLWPRRARARGGFGEALVAAAVADLGVSEDIGQNDGRRIREYFSGSRVKPPANWCAAATTTWIREAARAFGVAPPIPGSLQAKQLRDQIREAARRPEGAARWHEAEELRRDPGLLRPGMVVIWDRSDPARPETSWQGHVGIVVGRPEGRTFATVEGNSGEQGDRVARMSRSLADPRLLGAGALDGLGNGVRGRYA